MIDSAGTNGFGTEPITYEEREAVAEVYQQILWEQTREMDSISKAKLMLIAMPPIEIFLCWDGKSLVRYMCVWSGTLKCPIIIMRGKVE